MQSRTDATEACGSCFEVRGGEKQRCRATNGDSGFDSAETNVLAYVH